MKKNATVIYFAVCFSISFLLLITINSLIKEPLPPDTKFLNTLLPFTQQMFSSRTNDTVNYFTGILIFMSLPLLIWVADRKFKPFIWIMPVIIVFMLIINWPFLDRYSFLMYLYLKEAKISVIIIFASAILFIGLEKLRSRGGFKFTDINFDNRWSKSIIYLATFAAIFALVYNPKYQYSYSKLSWYGMETFRQFHHVNFFLGPINEIVQGKGLLVNVDSQYGILATYLQAILLKIVGVSYSNFVLYTMAISIVYTCLFFIFTKKITKSYFVAWLATLAYIKLAYFRNGPFWEAPTLPSTTPVRYFFDIIMVYLIWDYYKNPRPLIKTLRMAFVLTLALFYNFEIGLPILAAYIIVTLFDLFLSIIYKNNFHKKLKQLVLGFFTLETTFILMTLAIIIVTLVRSGGLPDWEGYLYHIFFYSKGFLDLPMQLVDFYYVPLIIYLCAYYYILVKIYRRSTDDLQVMVFLLIYGLISFVYYTGLSDINHLLTIFHPAVILAAIMLGHYYRKITRVTPVGIFTIVIFIVLIFGNPVVFIKETIARLQYRYSPPATSYYYWNYQGTNFYLEDNDGKDFVMAADEIKKRTDKEKDVLILSRYDTLLYLMTGKTSLVNYPILEYQLDTKKQLERLIISVMVKKPNYVFVYSDKYAEMQTDVISTVWTAIKDRYRFIKNAGAVDVYKKI